MPNWGELLNEINTKGSTHDMVRRQYLEQLYQLTDRNVIVYYSGWLQKGDLIRQSVTGFEVNDADKNGFMTTIHKMDRSKGLDLLLHTPGGETAATESLVDYLRSMFNTNIRAIVPQIALSAGTMIACACKEIVMGKQSSLGPIDPLLNGLPAHAVIEEFKTAAAEVKRDPSRAPLWQVIMSNYKPTLIGECDKAIKWSEQMVKDWLMSGMFAGDPKAKSKAETVVAGLGSHVLTLSHDRHISMAHAQRLGLKVTALESDQALQEAVLAVHHACIHTLTSTGAIKIIENHLGLGFITSAVPTLQLRSVLGG